jgi:hypothetical protein
MGLPLLGIYISIINQLYARFYAVVCDMYVKFRNGIIISKIEELLPDSLKEDK